MMPLKTTSTLEDAIDDAIRRGVRDAMVRHARAGESVTVGREGRILTIPAVEVLAEMDARDAAMTIASAEVGKKAS